MAGHIANGGEPLGPQWTRPGRDLQSSALKIARKATGVPIVGFITGYVGTVAVQLGHSFMLAYTVFIYNFLLWNPVSWFLTLLLNYVVDPLLRFCLAKYTSLGQYTPVDEALLPPGQTTIFYSIANCVDTTFDLPDMQFLQFPFGPDTAGYVAMELAEARREHFLAMCSKLSYEDEALIRDMVCNRWGFGAAAWLGGGKATFVARRKFLPETYWYAFQGSKTVVVVFRGTNPMNLINWASDINMERTFHGHMGEVHDGFYAALFEPADDTSVVFESIIHVIEYPVRSGKQLFVAGHSLGGALSAVLLSALQAHPETAFLADNMEGMYTIGEPRSGDFSYAQILFNKYKGKMNRIVHAADIVPKVPAGLGYTHHSAERFLTSFYFEKVRVLKQEAWADAIEWWRRFEFNWAFFISCFKLVASPWQGSTTTNLWPFQAETPLRWITRFPLLLLPGLSDHFPGDYEFILRTNVLTRQAELATELATAGAAGN